jgi:hypothetical protein
MIIKASIGKALCFTDAFLSRIFKKVTINSFKVHFLAIL